MNVGTKFLQLLLACTIWSVVSAAIPKGTLVKQINGNVPIESLRIGDKVFSCNDPQDQAPAIAVRKIVPVQLSEIVTVTCQKGSVRTSADHLFFDPISISWVRAADLTPQHALLDANFRAWPCIRVIKQPSSELCYELELDEPHIYFISEHELLVHNFTGVELGIVCAIGGGEIVLKGITVGLIALGCCIGLSHVSSHDRYVEPAFELRNSQALAEAFFHEKNSSSSGGNNVQMEGGSGNKKPDDKDPKKEKTTIEDIVSESQPGEKTRGKSTLHEKSGGFEEAEKDFNRLNPSNIQDMKGEYSGKMGNLADGRDVNFRSGSKDGRVTLEVMDKIGNQRIKIRYGAKPLR